MGEASGAASGDLVRSLAALAALLDGRRDWLAVAPEAMALCAHAIGTHRVYLFQVHEVAGHGLGQSCVADYAAAGLYPLTGDASSTDEDLTTADATMMDWAARRRRGETISGLTRDLEGYLRRDFEAQGIRSFLSVPVHVDGRWWGHLGCDDCADDRAWSDAEAAFMATAARFLGAVIGRQSASIEASAVSRAAMLETALDAIITIDEAGRVLEFNRAAGAMFGWATADAVGRALSELVLPPRHADAHQAGLQRYLAGGEPRILGRRVETEARRADGSTFPVELSVTEVRAAARRFFTAYLRDITERRRAIEALAASEARFRALVADQTESVSQWDTDFVCVFVNAAHAAVLGVPADDLLGRPATEVIRPEVWRDLEPELRALTPDDPVHWSTDSKILADGREVWFEWSNRALFDAGGTRTGYLSVGRDVTERRRLAEELKRLAFVDRATGLPNRTAVAAPPAASPLAATAIVVDLIDFDAIAATFGRAFADELVAVVAARLDRCVAGRGRLSRASEGSLAVVTESDPAAADALARELRDAFQALFAVGERRVHLRVCLGVAREGGDVEQRLQNAEMACRRDRPGTIEVFDAGMRARQLDRLELEADLREAIDHRPHELRVAYQPIVDLVSGRPAGYEALARWHHPRRGLVPPGVFVPIAEATGLILPLGDHIVAVAAAAWRTAPAGGEAPFVSVNLAAQQVADAGLVERVAAILAAADFDPRRLHFELTESTLMAQTEETVSTLRRLKRLGTEIAIDDFGTGYSSFGYLNRLPVDSLKIDGSFVGRMLRSHADAVLVGSMVNLARGLGLAVVAEGVETAAQRAALIDLGCARGQGYLLGRPAEAPVAIGSP